MRYAVLLGLAMSLAPSVRVQAADPPRLKLKDGDRVVYLGNTFAEQDGSHGYLETLLTIRNPDVNFTFRNLGWSGDTVWGDARARFGTRADGFQHLKEHVLALQPTVLLVAYGMNESFAGKGGVAEFESGLNILLDTLAETKARVVLISPLRHEKLAPPLPDPARHNADLDLYRDAMAKVAGSRGAAFLDGSSLVDNGPESTLRLTLDGLHPTPRGYALLSMSIAEGLDPETIKDRLLALDEDRQLVETGDWTVARFQPTDAEMTFEATGNRLPDGLARTREGAGLGGWSLILDGFRPGLYKLKIDGKPVNVGQMGRRGRLTLRMSSGPESEQVEALRKLINKKNELYFHRWRPQNETYLFGFRKHEQGNNAVEIPQFDPLIAELEAEIHKLKKPVKHTYELVREGAGR